LGVAKASKCGEKTFFKTANPFLGKSALSKRQKRMKRALPNPKIISWRLLFTSGHLFSSGRRERPSTYPIMAFDSHPGRYPKHNYFLRRHRGQIRVFADIGCSFAAGSPTTIDAKKALGKKTEVYAVDVQDIEKLKPEAKTVLEKKNIILLVHSISEEPLPFKCDAIRFANVSYYMTQSDRRRALVNIWKSLKRGGYLLGAHVTKIMSSEESTQFVLRKVGHGFEMVSPRSVYLLYRRHAP